MKKKLFVALGAALVTISTVGVTAFASTSAGSTSTTSPNTTGSTISSTASKTAGTAGAVGQYRQFKEQLQDEIQKVKALQAQRKEDNVQIRDYFQDYKGQHVWKNNASALKAVEATHTKIVVARALLKRDLQIDKSARQAKHWGQLVSDLEQTTRDLQTLVDLKDTQVKNLQSVSPGSAAAAGATTDGTDTGL